MPEVLTICTLIPAGAEGDKVNFFDIGVVTVFFVRRRMDTVSKPGPW